MSKSLYLCATVSAWVLACASSDALAVPMPFDFVINPTGSGLNATLGLTANTAGTLIGNYDMATNPSGTRTKPAGLFQPGPGPTENLPVAMTADILATGPVVSQISGSFHLDIDPDTGEVALSEYLSNLLESGPVSLPLNLMALTENFKTASPDSFFPSVPVTLPFGDATLTALSAVGIGVTDVGTLSPIGPDHYTFSVMASVVLNGSFEALGTPFTMPPIPALIPLEGEIMVSGTEATLISMRMLQVSNDVSANLPLPTIPFDLPTVLPSGSTAHLLLNLTLTGFGAGAQGDQTLVADGTLVPEPASLGLLLVGLATTGMRRRRNC